MQPSLALRIITKLGIGVTLCSTLILVSCGGGGSNNSTNSTIVSGVASKGILNGATVCAFAISGGAKGAAIGQCTTTNATGNYSINLGTYTGPVLFEATGGTYTDEATGTIVTLASPLRSMLSNATGGTTSVAVTALTELAYQQANAVAGGLTTTNIQNSVASVQTNFGVVDIINILPVDALNVPANATYAQKTYALALATVSQYLNGQPTGTTLTNALQAMDACLTAPTTGCGSGATNVGTALSTALSTFVAGNTGFSGVTLPVTNFGSVPDYISATATNTTQILTVGTAMTSFSPLKAIGGATPYTYSYTGTLPTGLSFDTSTGAVTGMPTAYATADLVFSVRDANNNYAITTSTVNFTVASYVVQGGLTWMPVSSTYYTYAQATALCAGTINGQTGWRMPTQTELSALYTSGAMNGQGWALWLVWSSTPGLKPVDVPVVDTHYYVDLMFGGNVGMNGDTGGADYVTCVR